MLRSRSLLLFVLIGITSVYADENVAPPDSFQEFRKSLLSSYSSFREGVLKDYAKFLENVWMEYDTFKGEKRDSTPKPTTAPVAPVSLTPDATEIVELSPLDTPTAEKDFPSLQVVSAPSDSPTVKIPERGEPYIFDFYGIPMSVMDVDVKAAHRLEGSAEYARQWRNLSETSQGADLVRQLENLAQRLKLNDYLTFDLVRHYVNTRYASVHSSSRASIIHFILANMGYDSRIATTDSGDGVILLPLATKVYGIPYLTIDGRRYYIFADDSVSADTCIFTCKLPDDAPKGKAFNLCLNPMDLPVDNKPFDFSYGGLHLTGSVNANIFPIIYHYPQMEIGDYAQSVLDPDLRQSIVNQVKDQLGDKPDINAVNKLLQFTQSAFNYATDEQTHGFEKPYFFEEVLYYPTCDCEDRVIFYSYLLWNALGVENQMITYPGHESSAVAMPEMLNGDGYKYRGNTFYISDPTYIGAVTGQCMPNYKMNKPEIDFHYKK